MSSIYDPQSQRDPRWASEELGTVAGATIGSVGCFITVAAMMATHYTGQLLTPHDINQAMKAKGLYQQGDLWPDGALSVLYPSVLVDNVWNYERGPADLSKLAMDDTQERLIVVDFDHNPNDGIQTHALRCFSYGGTPQSIIVDDPWYGTRDNFALHYGNNPALTIQKIVGYRVPGWVPPWKTPSVQQQLATALQQLAAAEAAQRQAQAELAAYKASVVNWARTMPQ